MPLHMHRLKQQTRWQQAIAESVRSQPVQAAPSSVWDAQSPPVVQADAAVLRLDLKPVAGAHPGVDDKAHVVRHVVLAQVQQALLHVLLGSARGKSDGCVVASARVC